LWKFVTNSLSLQHRFEQEESLTDPKPHSVPNTMLSNETYADSSFPLLLITVSRESWDCIRDEYLIFDFK